MQNAIEDKRTYSLPNELAMHLSLKDVWLDYFINREFLVSQLQSGDCLIVKDSECLDEKGNSVLKFSKRFVEQIVYIKGKNYLLKSAKVNFIVYWRKEEAKQEIKVILPELYFEKITEK